MEMGQEANPGQHEWNRSHYYFHYILAVFLRTLTGFRIFTLLLLEKHPASMGSRVVTGIKLCPFARVASSTAQLFSKAAMIEGTQVAEHLRTVISLWKVC